MIMKGTDQPRARRHRDHLDRSPSGVEGLVDEIVDMVGKEWVVFEAPRKAQQVWFLRHLGPNVNLANIAPGEVLALETLRLGLRADTLFDFYRRSSEDAKCSMYQRCFWPIQSGWL